MAIRLARAWLRWVLPAAVRADLIGEMDRAYRRDRTERGPCYATWRYCVEAFGVANLRLGRELRDPRLTPTFDQVPARLAAMLQRSLSDIRISLRSLAGRPAFAVAVLTILAVGVGATTAIFTIVDHVLLRDLPYPHAERLVRFADPSHTVPDYLVWHDRTSSFDGVGAAMPERLHLTGTGTPRRLVGVSASPGFLEMLGAQAVLGRVFAADEFELPIRVAVLSHAFWTTHLGADPDIVGTSLQIDGDVRQVIGVLEPDFRIPAAIAALHPDVWSPLAIRDASMQQHGSYRLGVVARLGEGVTIDQANAELDALSATMSVEDPEHYLLDGRAQGMRVEPLLEATIGEVARSLYLLLAAVACLLLIACVNVANLLLARGTDRGREVALRSALGADRSTMIVQFLTESLVLAGLGTIGGVILAWGATEFVRAWPPAGFPRLDGLAVDLRVLAFAALAAAITGVGFGILPALASSRRAASEVLRESSGALSASAARRWLGGVLVVAQVAVALVLLAGAGLLFRAFLHLGAVQPGFDPDDLSVVPIGAARHEGPARLLYLESLAERLERIPGVQGVGVGLTLPLVFTGETRCCWFDRVTVDPEQETPFNTMANAIDDDYFATLGATLRAGRWLGPGDDAGNVGAILNVTTARNFFGTDDVVGRTFTLDPDINVTVVGVVDDLRYWGQSQPVGNQLYLPLRAFYQYFGNYQMALRAAPGANVMDAVRAAVWELDPDLPLDGITSMQTLIADSVAEPRFYAVVFAVFAVVAVLLSAGGVYATLAYAVGQRGRELGIRVALGASSGSVARMVMRHGSGLAAVGVGLGTAAALALSRVLESQLFGVSARDPLTFGAVAGLLLLVGMAASYLPARQAARSDPVATLRAD